jgi:hypothetical protein
LVSGGYVLADEDGRNVAPRQAGPEVLAMLEDEDFIRFMSMEGLTDRSRSGEFFLDLSRVIRDIITIQVFTCHW